MPLMRLLCIGDTGITRRPSRTDGVVSVSSIPSSTPRAITLRNIELAVPEIFESSRRMAASSGEAVSRTLPYWSMIRSISRCRWPSGFSSEAFLIRWGNRLSSPSSGCLKNAATAVAVAIAFDTSTKSEAGRNAPSALARASASPSSGTEPREKPMSDVVAASISSTALREASMALKSVMKCISSTALRPASDVHSLLIRSLTVVKPVFCSNVWG